MRHTLQINTARQSVLHVPGPFSSISSEAGRPRSIAGRNMIQKQYRKDQIAVGGVANNG
jgi:hypothetical protein